MVYCFRYTVMFCCHNVHGKKQHSRYKQRPLKIHECRKYGNNLTRIIWLLNIDIVLCWTETNQTSWRWTLRRYIYQTTNKQPTKETHRLTPVNNRIKINKSLLTPVNQYSVCNSLSKVPAIDSLLDREWFKWLKQTTEHENSSTLLRDGVNVK